MLLNICILSAHVKYLKIVLKPEKIQVEPNKQNPSWVINVNETCETKVTNTSASIMPTSAHTNAHFYSEVSVRTFKKTWLHFFLGGCSYIKFA